MNKILELTEKLEAQKHKIDNPEIKQITVVAEPVTKRAPQKPKKSNTISGGIISEIKNAIDVNYDTNVIHIRIPPKDKLKILLLSTQKVSIQDFVTYAVKQALSKNEVKQLLKELKNDME